jgi:hypothetical protein
VLAVAVTAPGRIRIVFFKCPAVETVGENLGLTIMAVGALYGRHGVRVLILDVRLLVTGDTAVVCVDRPHILFPVNGQLDGPAVDFNGKIRIGVTVEALLICQGRSVPRKAGNKQHKDSNHELPPALFSCNFQHDPFNLGF